MTTQIARSYAWAKLAKELKALETECFEIQNNAEFATRNDNDPDGRILLLAEELASRALSWTSMIKKIRAERFAHVVRHRAEADAIEARMMPSDLNAEHRTHSGTI